jgi:hypothetical protein
MLARAPLAARDVRFARPFENRFVDETCERGADDRAPRITIRNMKVMTSSVTALASSE